MPETLKMTRQHHVMLFVIGTLDGMREKGLVAGGRERLSPDGTAMFEQLKAEGFKPTTDEIRSAMRFLMDGKR